MRIDRILPSVVALLAAVSCSPLLAADIYSKTVYRCDAGGSVTFSDRPCGDGAQKYEGDAERLNVYEAPTAARSATPATRKPVRRSAASRSTVDEDAKRIAECQRIRESLRDIRTKMQRGYGVEEGERLKERQRKLKQGHRTRRCR